MKFQKFFNLAEKNSTESVKDVYCIFVGCTTLSLSQANCKPLEFPYPLNSTSRNLANICCCGTEKLSVARRRRSGKKRTELTLFSLCGSPSLKCLSGAVTATQSQPSPSIPVPGPISTVESHSAERLTWQDLPWTSFGNEHLLHSGKLRDSSERYVALKLFTLFSAVVAIHARWEALAILGCLLGVKGFLCDSHSFFTDFLSCFRLTWHLKQRLIKWVNKLHDIQ